MDIKAFYLQVDNTLRKGGYSLFDKLKLDNSDLVNGVMNSDPIAVAESLNAWVNPNKADGLERLPLPIAVDNNNELIVGMLLHKRAKPDVRAKDGESVLYKAVFWENEKIVRLLLDKGASPSFPNLDGKTPIQLAEEKGYRNILALLTNNEPVLRQIQKEKDYATHEAMKAKAKQAKALKLNKEVVLGSEPDSNEVELQNAQKVAINEKYDKSLPVIDSLITAIKSEDSQAVKYFTEQVKDINKEHEGESPIQLAIEGGKENLAIYFFDHGANLYVKDKEGNYTLLNTCVQHQMYDLLKIALAKKESIQQILNDPNQSFSPQFLAYKDPKMMNLLMENGADPYFGGKDGVAPVLKAMQKGSVAILPILAKYNAISNKKIEGKSLALWAIELKRPDWLNGLIAEKALKSDTKEEMNMLLNAANTSNDPKIIDIITSLQLL